MSKLRDIQTAWGTDFIAGRIGYDELQTIESLRAGVEAQREYASADTSSLAQAIKAYDPDSTWTLTPD